MITVIAFLICVALFALKVYIDHKRFMKRFDDADKESENLYKKLGVKRDQKY